jgi:Na+/alanine symporter
LGSFFVTTLAATFTRASWPISLSNTAITIITIPNLIMCILLSSKLKKHLKQYDADMKAQRF